MHPSDGKENGGGLQGQKVLKGQFLANERATDWVKGLLPANFFPLPFLFLPPPFFHAASRSRGLDIAYRPL